MNRAAAHLQRPLGHLPLFLKPPNSTLSRRFVPYKCAFYMQKKSEVEYRNQLFVTTVSTATGES